MTDRAKILITGTMTNRGLSHLENSPKIKIEYKPGLKGESLKTALKECAGLIIRTETPVDDALLESAQHLKLICRAGIGIDHIDLKACESRGIKVLNTPDANRNAVAELTLGLMIGLSRKIPKATQTLLSGSWDREALTGIELKGKILGIVGFGNIGRRVTRLATAFGMRVVANDPYVQEKPVEFKEVSLLPLRETLSASDFVSLHVPLTSETKAMANKDFFSQMKRGSFFLNTSRGQVCVEEDLLNSLKSGHIRGAALDVFEKEPLEKAMRFSGVENLILTPHTAGQTEESQEQMSMDAAVQVRDFFEKGQLRNQVI